jgi:hypothetical protein
MQGVLVFASSAARASAITSPQEGQYSYLKDTNSTEYYDGAAWIAAPIGDITGVTAGTGISGGGTSGTVTITNSMATEIAAKGDLIVGTGAATFDNLTVGANGTTLVADSLTATGLKWATPAAAGGMTLLSTTTLSGTSTVISSIDGTYTNLYVLVYGVTNGTADGTFFWRPNNTANLGCYRYPNGDTTFSASFGGDIFFNTASLNYQSSSTSNSQQIVINDYASSTAYKPFTQTGLFKVTDGTDAAGTYALGGIKTTSAITSIGFHKGGGGSFTAGTVKIYAVK